jgi:hypothetical protein
VSTPRLPALSAPPRIGSGDQGSTLDGSGDRTIPPSKPSYRDEVERTYLLLEENFEVLYQHCLTFEQKKLLSDTHSAARYALWKVGESVGPDERGVGATVPQDLKMANMQLSTRLRNLDDINAFLRLAAEAVRLAGSLAPPSADA